MIDISRTVICPCKNCPDRWIDIEARKRCHDNCEKFKEFKLAIEVNRQKRIQEFAESMLDRKRAEWKKQFYKKRYRT